MDCVDEVKLVLDELKPLPGVEDVERIVGSIEEQGVSVVVAGQRANNDSEGGILGVISVGDSIRPHARPSD
jgi:hypothetical protein